MDFAMFDKAEIEEMCRAIVENLKEEALAALPANMEIWRIFRSILWKMHPTLRYRRISKK